MTRPDVAADEVSVVIKGTFSPAMFTPAWLLLQELIGPSDLDDSEVQVITAEIAIFRVGNIHVNVAFDAFQASTIEQGDFERVRDLAIGVLSTLRQTPVGALGINRAVHFSVGNEDVWNRIGNALTPKEFWQGFLDSPGMRGVTIWGNRTDGYVGHCQVQVEPSTRVQYGVFVASNDHFALTRSEDLDSASRLLRGELQAQPDFTVGKNATAVLVLTEEWSASMSRAMTALTRVSRLGEV